MTRRNIIDRLREAFQGGIEAPRRHHHTIPDRDQATLLLMPAWQKDGPLGVKIATVFPSNQERDLPSVFGVYLLLDGMTGEPIAAIEARSLTRRRSAAASALAAGYLAREDAARLVMIQLLGSLKAELGTLDKVERIVKLLCMVNCTPEFGQQPAVANGASDLLVEVFGDKGRHARSAVGMAALPNNVCVEIEMIVEVRG